MAGFGGAFAGAAAAFGGQLLNNRNQRALAERAAANEAAAAALLVQDDFLHYQVMLVRGLDRGTWWRPAECSPRQATHHDFKSVLVALPNNGQTNKVADAQGWADYLIRTRATMRDNPEPRLGSNEEKTFWGAFDCLQNGREQLYVVSNRPWTKFLDAAPMLEELSNEKVIERLQKPVPGGHRERDA